MMMNLRLMMVLVFLFVVSTAWADIIHLKNGRNIEGVIEKENDTTVFVNVGFGLTGLSRQDIVSIEKSSGQDLTQLKGKWRKEYFSRPEFTPSGLEDVSENYVELEKSRKIALDSRISVNSGRDQLQIVDEELQKLKKIYETLSQRLSNASAHNDITTYNSLVSDYNAVNAKIQLNRIKFEDINKGLADQERSMSEYSKALRIFKTLIEEKKTQAVLMDSSRKNFLADMDARISQLENDFNKYLAGYTQDTGSLVVEALINQKIKARLVVDTGASLVVLSQRVAGQLGIDIFSKNNFFYTTVADGSKVKAYPILLNSLKVGNALMRNVQAAVLEENGSAVGDGLLGMSFLGNFALEIDTKSNSIVLKEFKME
jgi:clan AA aspartic protease (TIGR02281 family)